jgi:PKD repeat protein
MESGSNSRGRWASTRTWQILTVVAGLAALGAILALVFVGCGGEPPEADFTAQPASGETPLQVTFTDTSKGDPDSWTWDFGDGGRSTEQNPTHVYEAAGSFRVILTVANGEGSDDVVKPDIVVATAPATNAFCDSIGELRDAVDNLIDRDTITGGVDGLTQAVTDVRTALDNVRSSAGEEYSEQIDRVQNAVGAVQDLIEGIQGGGPDRRRGARARCGVQRAPGRRPARLRAGGLER